MLTRRQRNTRRRSINKIDPELLKGYLKEKGLSKRAFCRESGISMQTLNRILAGEKILLVNVLLKVAETLEVNLHDLIKREEQSSLAKTES